jgi:DNA-binding response OmpR family regulator
MGANINLGLRPLPSLAQDEGLITWGACQLAVRLALCRLPHDPFAELMIRKMKTLLVEDDVPLGSSLQEALGKAGYRTTWVRRAEDAKRFLTTEEFDLVLLDIVLPGESGFDLLGWIRERELRTPVVMLTARDAISDRVRGLDGGADDYLPKPFAIDELFSRIRAVTRRLGVQRSAHWRIGKLTIDTAGRRVCVAERDIVLSQREFDVLLVLASEPGRVFTRFQIERSSLAQGLADSNTVDVHIHNLRKKLGNEYIGTVRGVGYLLETIA